MLTFSPLGEKVNTIMVLIHQPVKKSTLGKIVKNCRRCGLHPVVFGGEIQPYYYINILPVKSPVLCISTFKRLNFSKVAASTFGELASSSSSSSSNGGETSNK